MPEHSSLAHAADTVAIEQLLRRYCRGVDRCDLQSLLSIWAEGATVDYGNGTSDAREWCIGVLDRLRAWDRTSHLSANMIAEIDGDEAQTETSVVAYHQADDGEDGDPAAHWMLAAGRYIDEWVRIDEQWRIRRRIYVMDWNEAGLSNCHLGAGPFERFGNVGTRWPDDLLYSKG